MPYRRLPNSVSAVLRTLHAARDTWRITANPADRRITPAQFAQLDDADPASLLSRFEKEAGEVDLALAAQTPLTSTLSQQAAQLTMFVSHFHRVLDLGIARGAFNPGARNYYRRPASATALPSLTTYDEVQEAADKISAGEAARQAAEGAAYRPMALPSAAEVASLRALFGTTRSQSQQAQANTNKQQEDVSALYPEAQALAVDICDTVEFNLRADPSASSRRAKAEPWGVVYIHEEAPPVTEPSASDANPVTPTTNSTPDNPSSPQP